MLMLLHLHSTICWLLRVRLLMEPDSMECSGNGAQDVCGSCICNRNYFGNKCECYYSEMLGRGPKNESAAIAQCMPVDIENPEVCSGRGKCECGYCRCSSVSESLPDIRYSGEFCECDDTSCPYHNGEICGGQGRCVCGKCMCSEDYTGEACECSTALDTCMSSNGQICNGQGNCVCGKCECDPTSTSQGPTCEDCLSTVEPSSEKCNYAGSLNSCGQCLCDEGYGGKFCECSDGYEHQCISPNTTAVCSDRGQCICGMCECFKRSPQSPQKYSGRFCECDDYSCSYHDNKLCGGHGVCICGECMCDEGYTGEACGCPTSADTCRSENGMICNGVGKCECGMCICDRDSYFHGPFCEECPTCPGRCMTYIECIQCQVYNTGKYTQEECYQKCPRVDIVDVIDTNDDRDDNTHLCGFRDEDGLYITFMYRYIENNSIQLTGQRPKTG